MTTTINGYGDVLTLSAASTAAAAHQPAGTSATPTTIKSKLDEIISVKNWGAIGDGSDSTASFSLAATNAPSAVNIVGAEGTLPRAPMCLVNVPAGNYLLTSEVNTGAKEVTWLVDQGAVITGYEFLNGKVMRNGQRQNDLQHGTTDYACGYSIRANGSLEDGAEVLGITTPSDLATYGDRDSVSLYVDNAAPPALVDVGTATYTSTTATVAAPTSTVLKRYRRGMIIDTKHSTKWSGFVDSWNTDGSVLTVTGWYLFGGGGSPSTPPNDGSGLVLNGFTKVWAHNSNVFLTSTGYASKATGFELGVLNNKGVLNFGTGANQIWGFDAVSLGAYEGANGFIARSGASKFFRGFQASDATQVGFYAGGTPQVGFWSEQTSGVPFRHTLSGVNKFSVSNDGSMTAAGAANIAGVITSDTALSVGLTASSNTPYIDFNSSGNAIDYDARILASGGSASSGTGALAMTCSKLSVSGTLVTGASAGTSTSAGVAVVEGSSTTQAPIFTARCGLNDATAPIFHFVKDRAVTNVLDGDGVGEVRFEGLHTGAYYRAAGIRVAVSGAPSATSMPGVFNIQVTKAGTVSPVTALRIQPDHHVVPGADNAQTIGSAALRWSTVYAGTGAINTSDARQKQQVRELTGAERAAAIRCKGLIRAFKFNDAVQSKGSGARVHFGVIAQEVKAAFEAEGLVAEEYAVLCYDEWLGQPASFDSNGEELSPPIAAGNRYGVRYDELMAFIISAL